MIVLAPAEYGRGWTAFFRSKSNAPGTTPLAQFILSPQVTELFVVTSISCEAFPTAGQSVNSIQFATMRVEGGGATEEHRIATADFAAAAGQTQSLNFSGLTLIPGGWNLLVRVTYSGGAANTFDSSATGFYVRVPRGR